MGSPGPLAVGCRLPRRAHSWAARRRRARADPPRRTPASLGTPIRRSWWSLTRRSTLDTEDRHSRSTDSHRDSPAVPTTKAWIAVFAGRACLGLGVYSGHGDPTSYSRSGLRKRKRRLRPPIDDDISFERVQERIDNGRRWRRRRSGNCGAIASRTATAMSFVPAWSRQQRRSPLDKAKAFAMWRSPSTSIKAATGTYRSTV